MLVEADDFFQQLIQLAVTEHAFDIGQSQWLGRVQAVGAGDQFTGALRAQITRMGLGDGLEEADLEACAFQRTDQA